MIMMHYKKRINIRHCCEQLAKELELDLTDILRALVDAGKITEDQAKEINDII